MKFKTLASLLAAVSCACVLRPASAAPTGADENVTKLHITGTGTAEAAPDMVTATLSAHAEAAGAVQAQSATNAMTRKAMAAAGSVSGVTFSAGAYTVGQRSADAKKNGAQAWEASQTITLHSENAETLLALTGRLQNDGLLLEGIHWSLSEEHEKTLRQEAEKRAVQDMQERSSRIAGLLSRKVSDIEDISVDDNGLMRPVMMMARMAAAPVATPEQQKVTARVQATVLLK